MNYNLKRIEEIEFFYSKSVSLQLLTYKHPPHLNWKQFLTLFFNELNAKYYSCPLDRYINVEEEAFNELLVDQRDFCLKNKNRSLSDIYRIVKNYYPKIRMYQVMGWLYEHLHDDSFDVGMIKPVNKDFFYIGHLNCGNINKRVFHNLETYGSHELLRRVYNLNERIIKEMCDENGFYYRHYRSAYLKYKKEKNEQ